MTTLKDQLAGLDDGTVSLEQVLSEVDRTVARGDGGADRHGPAARGGESESARAALRKTLADWRGHSSQAARAHFDTIDQRIRDAPSASALGGDRDPPPADEGSSPSAAAADPTPADPTPAGEKTVILARPIHGVGVGSVIKGRFRIEKEIGEGGMGKVFKAVDQVFLDAQDRNPYIALKVLAEGFRQHPKAFQTLQRETAKARSLAHSNIVRVYDCDRDGDTIFMTMEYLSGRPLDRITKEPGFAGLPFKQAMAIVEPAGRALAFAHRADLVHSDFKPSNVFLTDEGPDEGRVKVIDFGIARAVKRRDVGAGETERTAFDVGALRVLTPAYASPEMSRPDHKPDPRDDIFALACVTYELIAGKHPFARRPAIQAAEEGMEPKRPAGLDRARWKALREALAFDRASRTASVERFLRELATPSFLWKPAAAGLMAVVLFAGGAVWYALAPPETAPPETTPPERPPLQAAVAAELARVGCAALQPQVDDAVVRVNGYAGGEADLGALRAALAALPGVAQVAVDPVSVDDRYCPVLGLVQRLAAQHGGDDPSAAGANGEAVSLSLARTVFAGGDKLVLDVRGPPAPAYLYVDLYMPDGYVRHLYPQPGFEQQPTADTVLRLGQGGDKGSWTVGPPFGTELVVVVATPEPLYEPYRWEIERTEDYLADIAAALEALGAGLGEDLGDSIAAGTDAPPVSADIAAITTTP